LLRQIENLAMRLVLDGLPEDHAGAGEYLRALDWIHAEAQAAGRAEIAQLALEVSGMAGGDMRDRSEVERALQEGIGKLQAALDGEPPPVPATAERGASPAAAPNPLARDTELLSDFVLESREHLAAIENLCLTLERDPGNAEAVHTIFRAFHTIKGLAGFLDMAPAQEVAHEAENILDLARNSALRPGPDVIDVVLAAADFLKAWVDRLDCELKRQPSRAIPPSTEILTRIRQVLRLHQNATTPTDAHDECSPLPPPAKEPGTASPRALDGPSRPRAVKVDTGKLDYLVDMAGEMVIAQALVRHDPDLAALKSPRIQRSLSQLARITSEIQKTSMSMRLVPVGQLFQRTARVVRDLSRKMGKPAELEISGEDTEIDRTFVEELADPLMHMVRNSLDHGLEDEEARLKAGKSPVGRIGLRAHHRAGHVIIEVWDDGRGLDKDKILARAIQNGLTRASATLSEQDVFNLIFEPGFSTAARVTDVSGRGVGMDVVRRHIQKLRGRTEIRSVLGKGATFVLKLPLTLAIIDGLVVGVGEERYILPMFSVWEMFRPAAGAVHTVQNSAEMVLVRGKLLPVIRLHERFGVKPRSEDPCQGLLIVTESEGRRFCLLVDDLIGKQELVIKSLGETFKGVRGIAGGAILGDGRVGLILDLDGLLGGRASE
jgi:two-component system chemotaxis sensor kinase CheA